MIEILYAIAYGFLNRARGSGFYDRLDSTLISRLLMAFGCAALNTVLYPSALVFMWTIAGLMLWAVWGWGKYFASIHGVINNEKEFFPVDWIMSKLSIADNKLWGLTAMTLRQMMIIPYFIGLSLLTDGFTWYFLTALLMGAPYYLSGLTFKQRQVEFAEYGVGGIIGLTSAWILMG